MVNESPTVSYRASSSTLTAVEVNLGRINMTCLCPVALMTAVPLVIIMQAAVTEGELKVMDTGLCSGGDRTV